jgi:hypothetical protein
MRARSVVAGVIDWGSGGVWSLRLAPGSEATVAWLPALPARVRVVYEAGPTGYGLARACAEAGIACGAWGRAWRSVAGASSALEAAFASWVCLRGVSTLTAFALTVELGDWHRFRPQSLGPFPWSHPERVLKP